MSRQKLGATLKNRWHRAQYTLRGRGPNVVEGTVSVYLKYDLRVWTFGLRFDYDESWFDFHIDVGPIELSFIYWRQYVAVLDL